MLMDHHSNYAFDLDNREAKDEPAGGFSPYTMSLLSSEDSVILNKGTLDNINFEWMITPWSECSQTCGIDGSGYRVSRYPIKIYLFV